MMTAQYYSGGSPYGPPAYYPGAYNGSLWTTRQEHCEDYVSTSVPYEDHNLFLWEKTVKSHGAINASYANPATVPSYGYQYVYSVLDYSMAANWSDVSGCPAPEGANWNYLKTEALLRLNPFRPAVDLRLFVFEFKDFPRMLRGLGQLIQIRNPNHYKWYKRAGLTPQLLDLPEHVLSYNFGWEPLLNDLSTMIDLADAINKRWLHIQKMKEGKRFGGKLPSSESSSTGSLVTYAQVRYFPITKKVKRAWYTARYAAQPPAFYHDESSKIQSIRTLLGLRRDEIISSSTLWNMIPWTWLIDYFLNMGTYFEATRGYAKFTVARLNVMESTIATTTPDVQYVHPSYTFEPFVLKTVTKRRQTYVYPTAALAWKPFLTDHHRTLIGTLVLASILRSDRSGFTS